MRFVPLLVLALVACGRLCPRESALVGLDGGALSCVSATDCPRPTNVLVCGNAEDRLRDCVACIETRCVRFVPEACP